MNDKQQRIVIELANGFKLVAEQNNDPMFKNEIFIGIMKDDDSKPRKSSKQDENLSCAHADVKFENMHNIEIYVTERVINAFLDSKEIVKGFKEYPSYLDTVKNYAHFVFLDSSDIYERCSDEPFSKVLIDTCIELCLYRDGFALTANKIRQN